MIISEVNEQMVFESCSDVHLDEDQEENDLGHDT